MHTHETSHTGMTGDEGQPRLAHPPTPGQQADRRRPETGRGALLCAQPEAGRGDPAGRPRPGGDPPTPGPSPLPKGGGETGRGARRGAWLGAYAIWIALLLAVAAYQRAPGYMDEAYYWVVGRTWAAGQGLVEPFLWNYLDDPAGLPHPAGAYWQPLPALLVGLVAVWPRLPFVLLAAALPWLTARLAQVWGAAPATARRAGLWAALSGFYLAYLPAVDGFAPLMALGAAYWLTLPRALEARGPARKTWFALGLLTAGVHLTRAEGLLWLAVTLAAAARSRPRPTRLAHVGAALAGYTLLMLPWWARNLGVWGAPWPPGQSRALWLTEYNDLFLYPAAQLTFARWWAQGLGDILRERAWALGLNLQTSLAVQGLIVLAPLALIAAWRARHRPALRWAAGLYAAVFGLMTVVFPHAGARGGWFHAGAGFQPLLWVLAAQGFDAALAWAAPRRGWELPQARRVLGAGLTALLVLLTVAVAGARLSRWNAPAAHYAALWDAWQAAASPQAVDGPVLIANPPLWVWVTGRPALVTPSGDEAAVTAVARRYAARGLVVEADHTANLAAWWASPGPRPGWRYLGPGPDAQLYEFTGGSR